MDYTLPHPWYPILGVKRPQKNRFETKTQRLVSKPLRFRSGCYCHTQAPQSPSYRSRYVRVRRLKFWPQGYAQRMDLLHKIVEFHNASIEEALCIGWVVTKLPEGTQRALQLLRQRNVGNASGRTCATGAKGLGSRPVGRMVVTVASVVATIERVVTAPTIRIRGVRAWIVPTMIGSRWGRRRRVVGHRKARRRGTVRLVLVCLIR